MRQAGADGENYTRTDLACEWGERESEREGVELTERAWAHGTVERLHIVTPGAAERLGRPVGAYITVSCPKIWEMEAEVRERLEEELAGLLVELLERETGKTVGGGLSVLVVGLGNRDITADAVGPGAMGELLVTRHLKEQEPAIFERMDCCAISALAPGVLGQTGMEVADVIAGAVRCSCPDAILAVDALIFDLIHNLSDEEYAKSANRALVGR